MVYDNALLPNKRLRDESDFRMKATLVTEKFSLSHYLEEKERNDSLSVKSWIYSSTN